METAAGSTAGKGVTETGAWTATFCAAWSAGESEAGDTLQQGSLLAGEQWPRPQHLRASGLAIQDP